VRTGTSLARLGLAEAWAEATASSAGGPGQTDRRRRADQVGARPRPRPSQVLRCAESLLQAALRDDVVLRGRLIALLGSSSALADPLVAHRDRWHWLTADAPPPDTDVTATLLCAVGADRAGPPLAAAYQPRRRPHCWSRLIGMVAQIPWRRR
jgi:glutamate-ammonia-ligase adenylyltransferase